MVAANCVILEESTYYDCFKDLIQEDEIYYNPMMNALFDILSPHLRHKLEKTRAWRNSAASPTHSFSSIQSSNMNEENSYLERFVQELGSPEEDEIDFNVSTSGIPENLYASRVIQDEHTNLSDDELESMVNLVNEVARNPGSQ